MPKITIETNSTGVITSAQRYAALLAIGVSNGIMAGADLILKLSHEVCPIDKGVMIASSQVRKEGLGFNTVGIVSYSTPYAVVVHEDPTKRHGAAFNAAYAAEIAAGLEHMRRPQEKYKFLEEPIKDNLRKIGDEVAKAIQGYGIITRARAI